MDRGKIVKRTKTIMFCLSFKRKRYQSGRIMKNVEFLFAHGGQQLYDINYREIRLQIINRDIMKLPLKIPLT